MDRGNSFAHGDSAGGPRSPRRWHDGWQAPEPVTVYRIDGELYS
jgi:hypothetical protein